MNYNFLRNTSAFLSVQFHLKSLLSYAQRGRLCAGGNSVFRLSVTVAKFIIEFIVYSFASALFVTTGAKADCSILLMFKCPVQLAQSSPLAAALHFSYEVNCL